MNLKFLLEARKPDKNLIKYLDTELNNTLLYQKKLLTVQNEWTRLNDILTAEQKWLDELNVSISDLTKASSNNYYQTLINIQVKKIYFIILYIIVFIIICICPNVIIGIIYRIQL